MGNSISFHGEVNHRIQSIPHFKYKVTSNFPKQNAHVEKAKKDACTLLRFPAGSLGTYDHKRKVYTYWFIISFKGHGPSEGNKDPRKGKPECPCTRTDEEWVVRESVIGQKNELSGVIWGSGEVSKVSSFRFLSASLHLGDKDAPFSWQEGHLPLRTLQAASGGEGKPVIPATAFSPIHLA